MFLLLLVLISSCKNFNENVYIVKKDNKEVLAFDNLEKGKEFLNRVKCLNDQKNIVTKNLYKNYESLEFIASKSIGLNLKIGSSNLSYLAVVLKANCRVFKDGKDLKIENLDYSMYLSGLPMGSELQDIRVTHEFKDKQLRVVGKAKLVTNIIFLKGLVNDLQTVDEIRLEINEKLN